MEKKKESVVAPEMKPKLVTTTNRKYNTTWTDMNTKDGGSKFLDQEGRYHCSSLRIIIEMERVPGKYIIQKLQSASLLPLALQP